MLAAVLLLVWVASFFVPAGAYKIDPETLGPVPGSYRELPACSDVEGDALCVETAFDQRLKQLFIAPPNGLYGIENDRGFVSADETGALYGSAMIFLFVLAVGAFITVTMKTEAIQTGIGRLALRFRHSGSVLIAILMAVFALGGTSYGMWEETLGFFVLLVPLALALGYDRMVAAAIIFLGAGTGVLCSTVNPFATGVASDAAGISLGDGIGVRIAMWIVLVALAIGYVIRYASRVAQGPGALGRRDRAHRRGGSQGADLGRARAHRAPEARAGAVRRLVPGDDLRLHPLERPLAGGLGQGLPAARPSARSTSRRRRRCSS